MNKLKGFFLENKQYIMLAASVLAGILLICIIIAVIIGRKEDGNETVKNTIKYVEEKSEKNTTDRNTTDRNINTDTDETAGVQDETTGENETEAETINPDLLPYKIMVNRAANCITVYGKDTDGKFTVPIKAITCSTGKSVGDTPLGNFNTLVSYKWLLMVDGSYGQYAYRFYGPILFHSVPYYSQDKGDLEWEQYNKLGEPASLGCVRVTVADAIWLIENCPVGTYVEVYDDAKNPGPLGKPDTIKIPANSPNKGWDPTDPDENNPWHKCTPEIKISKTQVEISKGSSTAALLKALGAKGYDTCGNEVTSKVDVTGIDLNKAGTYSSVKLNLTDAIGKTAKEVIVKVVVKAPDTSTPEQTTEKKTNEESSNNETTSDTSSETTEDEDTEGENGSASDETTTPEQTTPAEGSPEETTTP